jgi:PKHD-type hydroxylase
MITTNKYWCFNSQLSPEVCDEIIKLGTSSIEKNKKLGISSVAYTFGNKEKSDDKKVSQGELSIQQLKNTQDKNNIEDVYIRDSEVSWLNDKWLYDTILPYVRTANKNSGWKYDIDYFENFQFTVYNSPGGFYGWHNDMSTDHHASYKRYIYGITEVPLRKDGHLPFGYTKDNNLVGKLRKISVTINLTNPLSYEGGNLKFDFGNHFEGDRFYECVESRQQGSIIVFPSYSYHCVTPVTKGTRYSLVLWCSGKPFK